MVHTVLQMTLIPVWRLIGIISSHTQERAYCTVHSSFGASQLGVDAEKLMLFSGET